MTEEEKLEQELAELIADVEKEKEELDKLEEDEFEEDEDNIEDDDNLDDEEHNDDKNSENDDDLGEESDDEDDDSEKEEEDNSNNDDDNEDSEDDDKFEPIEIEVGDMKISVESKEELLALAKKGIGKNNTARKESEVERMISQSGLTKEDLIIAIDAKNGDANAIAKLAEIGKVNVLDLESEMASSYESKFKLEEVNETEVIAGQILSDEKLADDFRKTISMVSDEDFVQTISSDPEILKSFAGHVKSGLANKIIPLATKDNAINGGTFWDSYVKIGRELHSQSSKENNDNKEQKEKKQERNISDREKKLRKRANIDGKNNEGKKSTGATEIWDMSEEEFNEFIENGGK